LAPCLLIWDAAGEFAATFLLRGVDNQLSSANAALVPGRDRLQSVVISSTPVLYGGMVMVPEIRDDAVERQAWATTPVQNSCDLDVASMTTDGSEETLFDYEQDRGYDLGEGD
jgi:hypothetical protein